MSEVIEKGRLAKKPVIKLEYVQQRKRIMHY